MDIETTRKHMHELLDALFDCYVYGTYEKYRDKDALIKGTYNIGVIPECELLPGHLLILAGQETPVANMLGAELHELKKAGKLEEIVDRGTTTRTIIRMKDDE